MRRRTRSRSSQSRSTNSIYWFCCYFYYSATEFCCWRSKLDFENLLFGSIKGKNWFWLGLFALVLWFCSATLRLFSSLTYSRDSRKNCSMSLLWSSIIWHSAFKFFSSRVFSLMLSLNPRMSSLCSLMTYSLWNRSNSFSFSKLATISLSRFSSNSIFDFSILILLFYSYCFLANSSTASCFWRRSALYCSFSEANFCAIFSVWSISSSWRSAWPSSKLFWSWMFLSISEMFLSASDCAFLWYSSICFSKLS